MKPGSSGSSTRPCGLPARELGSSTVDEREIGCDNDIVNPWLLSTKTLASYDPIQIIWDALAVLGLRCTCGVSKPDRLLATNQRELALRDLEQGSLFHPMRVRHLPSHFPLPRKVMKSTT